MSEAAASGKPKKMQCRYLKTGGTQCRGIAIRGQDYCHLHGRHRHPHFRNCVSIPLLEDLDSIQVVVSQVVQSVLTGQIEHDAGTLALRGLRIAATLLGIRLHQERVRKTAAAATPALPPAPEPLPEPVEVITETDTGDVLAPESEYEGPGGKRELRKVWSFEKMLYNEHLRQQGRPEIEYEDDFPEEGYLTREELIAQREEMIDIVGPARAHLLPPIEAVADSFAVPGAPES
ncbi:hypothetical protein [Paracidobacterium acidisoli]|uniref:Uncharacterized protein n=1 Tax=Paracidobacterium acidisoli TaxID=2303751 RepID=A0A372ISF3_9BACT|nr:hypothetical protein [Paracidobacterium acidisoli]MBT9330775.1 hypothetical protein [Paracidobacterium acidisoli]